TDAGQRVAVGEAEIAVDNGERFGIARDAGNQACAEIEHCPSVSFREAAHLLRIGLGGSPSVPPRSVDLLTESEMALSNALHPPGSRATFSAWRCRGRPNTWRSGGATGRWDAHRYGKRARLPAIVASRLASPPTSPAARRPSGQATDSCYPSLRRRASSSSR